MKNSSVFFLLPIWNIVSHFFKRMKQTLAILLTVSYHTYVFMTALLKKTPCYVLWMIHSFLLSEWEVKGKTIYSKRNQNLSTRMLWWSGLLFSSQKFSKLNLVWGIYVWNFYVFLLTVWAFFEFCVPPPLTRTQSQNNNVIRLPWICTMHACLFDKCNKILCMVLNAVLQVVCSVIWF